MADGIEFLIDIQSKLDEANKASRALDAVTVSAGKTDKAVTGAEAEFQRLQKHLTALRRPGQIANLKKDIAALENPQPARQMGVLAKGFGMAESAALGFVGGLGAMAGGVIISGIGTVIGKVRELGTELLMTAGEAQRTERVMGLLFGERDAPGVIAWTDQIGRFSEFTDGAIKGFAVSLKRAGFEGEGLSRAMSGVLDIAAMTENKFEGAAAATSLLSRINLKGGLGRGDLVKLGISPEAFFKRMADDLGIGVDAVEKRLMEGKISTMVAIEGVYQAIADKTGKPLGGAGLSMSTNFLTQIEKTKDIVPRLFGEMSKTGSLDQISAALGRLTQALSPEAPGGKAIIEGLEKMLNAFADLLNKVDMEKFAATTVKIFELMPPVFEAATKALQAFAVVLERVISRGSVLGGIGEAAGKGLGLGDKASGILGTAFEIGKGGPAGVPAALGQMLGRKLSEGFAGGIQSGAPAVTTATADMFRGAENELKTAAQIQSPSRVFMDLGTMTALGYRKGIVDSEPDVREAVQRAFRPPTPEVLQPDGYAAPGGSTSIGGDMHAAITINIGGGGEGGEEGKREIAVAAEHGTIQAMQRMFERWQNQIGSG